MATESVAIQKVVLILTPACSVAVRNLWIKVKVIHRRGYPLFYHRVMDRAQAGFSTAFKPAMTHRASAIKGEQIADTTPRPRQGCLGGLSGELDVMRGLEAVVAFDIAQ